ncbi:MAG: glutaredoxin [Thaumarchaeota archaeon]|nr:glutaredoxin [Nitrososphaerota archaeon]
MPKAVAFHVVYAKWCPHCVPIAVDSFKRAASELGITCRLYDIDTEDEARADEIVKQYGDWTEDYLVPQVFLELDGGEIKHVLTGDPRGVDFTTRRINEFLGGPLYASLKPSH